MGRNSIINDENRIWWHLGRIWQIKNTRVWETQDRMIWRFIGKKPDLIITDGRQWWKEVSSRIYELRILKQEKEIMKGTSWSRIKWQNSVDQGFLEIVGNGKPTGSVRKETIAVSVTISKGVQKRHSRILLRALLRGQNERNAWRSRSPRGKSPSGSMSRWPCKDYLKETGTNSFCDKWHPSECLFYKSESGWKFEEKVLLCASPGWWTAWQKVLQEWRQKCSGCAEN